MTTELLVKEDKSPTYPPRTHYNAKTSHTTLALAVDLNTRGEILTRNAAGEEKYLGFQLDDNSNTLDIARKLYKQLKRLNATKLNVAGNGIYTLIKSDCTQEQINQFVYDIIAQVHAFWPLERIYTGGQTGVDIAGAVAGYALGIPTEVTLPKGYLQRFEDNKDVQGSKEKVEDQITQGALALQPYTVVGKKNNESSQHKP